MCEKVKERIALYRDFLKILSVFSFGVGGGTISLLFRLENPVAIPLLFLGFLLEVSLLFSMMRIFLKIEALIEELKDE